MICSFWNILDALAVFPPLVELFLGGGGVGAAGAAAAAAAASSRSSRARASLGSLRGSSFDFRWFKALRALRVMRVALLAGELGQMHASSSGRLLASAASVRLFQLVASVATLLFTTSAVVNLVERIPFHDALYFVTTTLTTVGYGDVVVKSTAGKFAVLVMILLGVIIIPAQSSALWAQLQARRVTLGPLPAAWRKQPHVLVSARLSDVRGFSDFLMEFFAAGARAAAAAAPAGENAAAAGSAAAARPSSAAGSSPLLEAPLPRNARMVVLGGKPDFEFRALQELNERRLTLVEGSALSERDLARARAEAAAGVLLLADRFSPSPAQEDLNVLFQVWAVKSYTRCVVAASPSSSFFLGSLGPLLVRRPLLPAAHRRRLSPSLPPSLAASPSASPSRCLSPSASPSLSLSASLSLAASPSASLSASPSLFRNQSFAALRASTSRSSSAARSRR